MTAETKTRIIATLESTFTGAGRAAAVNEVLTADTYPEYLAGILAEAEGVDAETALTEWSIRRGRMWE
jgi:hypothetical protein